MDQDIANFFDQIKKKIGFKSENHFEEREKEF